MEHRLNPLLRPRSVAIVGASNRPDSMGEWVLKNLDRGGYRGGIYPVNPAYETLQGHRCFAALADLPETPDLVIFAVGDRHLEAVLDEAIAAGIPAAVIQSPLIIDDDSLPVLRDRVRQKIESAGMLVCGGNGMGYYNVRDHVWSCGFDSTAHEAPGNVALISHSGSGMSGIIDCEARLRINVAVSTGNELGVTMDEYLDFVLDLPETRVVGLFVETARNPDGFRAALSKASQKRIPVVALKVGRTDKSAALTVSHSGAIAGDDATYEALFNRYGVQRARDQDEFATMLIMFAELHPAGAGGLVALHDSGGERQLLVDLAHDAGVPLTELSETTVSALDKILDPELPAVNPLDAWSRGGPDAGRVMTQSLSLMMQDAGAALAAVIHDRAPGGKIYASYLSYMQRARAESGKPVALVAARQGTGYDEAVVASTHTGFPVLDGVSQFLRGVHALFAYRDFLLQEAQDPVSPDRTVVKKWQGQLRSGGTLAEIDTLLLLEDFGIPTSKPEAASSEEEVLDAANRIGYPLTLKTAKEGLLHKTDRGGVILGIRDADQLRQMYQFLRNRLGNDVLVAPMVATGIEMFLGLKRDPQFGPIVILGFGGVLAETINDVQFALPPFDAAYARRCIDRMRLRPLLDGVRGSPAVDIDSFCETASRFSVLAHALSDVLSEVDVNPVIVNENGAIAVDAFAVGRDRRETARV
ncbi:MAG: acetate--CoA ligase family protein [Gammaproteobacteria bacterium]|nr:acetate--CoA ligase family protein [Gammaproteobacteria bacterium]MDH3363010.1 acetate--CoA ligase family protein [Gammaproteobacteria bacterium]MDH3480998.1 acetate--CoA ligase family protein [Gammaproteobacteria bacterium]